MKKILIILAVCCLALTPAERKEIKRAKDFVDKAKQENVQAWDAAKQAWDRAYEAEQHSKKTDVEIGVVKKQIQESHDNEKRLADDNAKMKPVYDEVHKWFGIGAILFGIKMLMKNLLILTLVLSVLGVGIYALSFAFPFFGIAIKFVWGWIKIILRILRGALSKFASLKMFNKAPTINKKKPRKK